MKIRIPHLPFDLLSDILSRLPAKTVLRFKIICKSWRDLISDNNFVNYHLERSLATKTNLHYVVSVPRFYLQQYDHLEEPTDESCPVLYSADFDSLENPFELRHPFKNWKTPLMIFGSCCGLLLLRVDYGHLLLYNPTTQTYNVLPHLSVYQAANEYPIFDYGFGYDTESRDYKCVRIMQCMKEKGHHIGEVMVYSMRSNSWKRVSDIPFFFHSRGWDFGVLSDEMCHWIGENSDKNGYPLIVAFSLRDETFSCVPLPHLLQNLQKLLYSHFNGLYVGVLDGCLSLSANRHPQCDLWVMKEYGVEESWTRMYTFGTLESLSLDRPINYSIDKKRSLFKTWLRRLHCFDLETMEHTDCDRGRDAHVYVENLLMLDYAELVRKKLGKRKKLGLGEERPRTEVKII